MPHVFQDQLPLVSLPTYIFSLLLGTLFNPGLLPLSLVSGLAWYVCFRLAAD